MDIGCTDHIPPITTVKAPTWLCSGERSEIFWPAETRRPRRYVTCLRHRVRRSGCSTALRAVEPAPPSGLRPRRDTMT
jgi:hypothetical protein